MSQLRQAGKESGKDIQAVEKLGLYFVALNHRLENVRQLRGLADDYCPNWAEGEHTYDYSEGGCRQVKDVELTMNLGWASPPTGSALIMHS